MSGHVILQWLVRAAFLGLALVAIRAWLAGRVRSAAWMAATFSSLGVAVVAGLLLPDDPEAAWEVVAQRLIVATVLAFPYLLYRFTVAIQPARRATDRLVVTLTALAVLATFALPEFPAEGEPEPGWFGIYLGAVLAVWTLVSVVVAVRLWRAGQGEPRLARQRMRFLAGGAVSMAFALVLSGTAGGGDNGGVDSVVQLAALASAGLFYFAYSPPQLLRVWWRRSAESAVREAVLELIAATTPEEVTASMLPRVEALVGARRVALVDSEDRPAPFVAPGPDDGTWLDVEVHDRTLRVWTSPYSPVFGDEELQLLSALTAVAELALQRTRLLQSERDARTHLERSNTELEQFAYVASHDLKEPLQLITGFAHILGDRYRDRLDESADRYLEVIQNAAERMRRLIDDLLALSHVGQSGKAFELVALEDPLDDALSNLGQRIKESGAAIDVARPLPTLVGDRRLLVQLFQNLVGNALKYSGDRPPKVRVEAHQDVDSWTVIVSDEGEGIDPRYHDQVFEPFRRLHGEDGPEGTGIGLAIVKKIVDLHGGQVWVDSASGEGATFRLTLPSA